MSTELKSQIRRYAFQMEEDQESIGAAEVLALLEPIRELPSPPPPEVRPVPRRVWVAAVVGAAVVLVLVGGFAWLFRAGSGIDTVDQPSVTTPEGSESEPATGPGLLWVQSDLPAGLDSFDRIITGGARYYLMADDSTLLFDSDEGLKWQPSQLWSDPGRITADRDPETFQYLVPVADGERIAVVLFYADHVEVQYSSDSESWIQSALLPNLPVPDLDLALVRFYPGFVDLGPAGMMITGSFQWELDYERILRDRFGDSFADDLKEATLTAANAIVASTESGREESIPISELGLDIEDLWALPVGSLGWFSPDGTNWVEVSRDDPLGSPFLNGPVAIEDGFLMQSTVGRIHYTADGSRWEIADDRFNFELRGSWTQAALAVHMETGSLHRATSTGVGRALPFSGAFPAAGDAGILAVEDTDGGTPPFDEATVIFSPDGVVSRQQDVSGLGPIEGWSVGTDRVFLITGDTNGKRQLWVGIPEG